MKANKIALSIDEQIAQLTKQKEASDKVKGLIAPQLETLRKLQGDVTDAKNAADTMGTAKNGIWEAVFTATQKIEEATRETPQLREQVFTDALADFLIVPATPEGKPGKLTTVGQYASTARKVLVELVTVQGIKLETLADKSVADIRKMFRKVEDQVMLNDAAEASKRIRYVIKHGKPEEKAQLNPLFQLIREVYDPIKARKDANSKANTAQKELNANMQQHPSAPTVVETVAANLETERDNAEPAEDAGENPDKAQAAVG